MVPYVLTPFISPQLEVQSEAVEAGSGAGQYQQRPGLHHFA